MGDLITAAGTGNNQSVSMFNFGNSTVRVCQDVNGEPWFVAKDVAAILGYSDTNAMTRRLEDDDICTYADKTSGQVRNIYIINESGLYNAIMGSNKPEAKSFKKWVTSEVLPSIRKHGAYMTPDTIEKMLSNPDLVIGLATELKEARAVSERQQLQIAEQRRQLEIQAPDVEYCQEVLSASNLHTTNSVAMHIGVSAMKLNKFLVDEDWIYKQGGIYYASCKIRGKDYADFHVIPYVNRDGETMTREHLKWTEKGRRAIIDLWNKKHTAAVR
jgi:prophage antirepressor-like protein